MNFTPKIVATRSTGKNTRKASGGMDTVLVTVIKGGGDRHQVCVRVGTDVMKSQRWIVGDHVQISFGETDEGPAIQIRRTTDGHKLSSYKKSIGTMSYASVKIASDELIAAIRPFAGTSTKPQVMPDGSLIVVLEKRDAT